MSGRSEVRLPSSGGGGGASGCFAAGTFVRTAAGPRDIATLAKGDSVVTFDQELGAEVVRPILKAIRTRNVVWQISFVDGRKIRTTASHSLCVDGSWKKVSQIKEGDCLTCVDANGRAETRRILGMSRSDRAEDVYNLVVQGNFTFVADDVLAHSFSHLRTARIWGWSAYAGVVDSWRSFRRTISQVAGGGLQPQVLVELR